MTLAATTIMALRGRAEFGQTALDVAIFAIAAAVCGLLFFQGGFEALIGAGIGALVAKRSGAPFSAGAFAGLFAGALFAGFFHGALVSLIAAFS